MLGVEVTRDPALLPRVGRLRVELLLLIAIPEYSVVGDSIHLRGVLLPEVERMRLQMCATRGATCTQALLGLARLHGSGRIRSRQLLGL